MSDDPRKSRYSYTKQQLELNKVIAHAQQEIAALHKSGNHLSDSYDHLIAHAEALARKKGVSDYHLELMKMQAKDAPSPVRDISERLRSWDEIVDEADRAITGDVFMEDICSQADFEYALKYVRDINEEFNRKTELTAMDMAFMAIATALQVARQYVLQPFLDKNRMSHAQNDAIVKGMVPKSWHDILLASVPYDASERLDKDSPLPGLGGGAHRYRTLGHDPVLGWLFGPINILSDSLTKYDFISSHEVIDMKVGKTMLTSQAFAIASEQAKIKFNLPVSIVRQALHFGSDYFSSMGLPLPIISSANNNVSRFLMNNKINMLNVTQGAMLSSLINFLISCTHGLFNTEGLEPDLYQVRTRKILSISNTIATASNIAFVAISGNAKKLDIGGALVTIRRLCTDLRFMARVKQEFIEGKLDSEWDAISRDIDHLCRSAASQ